MATHYAREQCVQYARTSKEETAESAVWEVSSEMRCDPQRKVERNCHSGVGAAYARAHLLQEGVRENASQLWANGVTHNQCAGHMSLCFAHTHVHDAQMDLKHKDLEGSMLDKMKSGGNEQEQHSLQ